MRKFEAQVVQETKTRFVCSVFFCVENRAVCAIMWKNIVESDRPLITLWRMHFAGWILKSTNRHSEYVMLIAFPLQQWLHAHASLLHYKYIACLVMNLFIYSVCLTILSVIQS